MNALRQNLALLLRSVKGTAPGRFARVGIEILDLTETPDFLEIPWTPPGKTPATGPRLRFSDDFNDGVIDRGKWETRGSTVIEASGELQILTTATDQGGQARTLPIPIAPDRPLSISRRVMLHPGNEFLDGKLVVGITGYPEKTFGVSYANYHYRGAGEGITVGFSLVRHNANSHRYADRRVDASPLIPPIWDRYFTEELRYDPKTGEVRYSIDGKQRLVYNVGPLPPNTPSITLTFFPWGWYTGHSQKMDWVRVEQ